MLNPAEGKSIVWGAAGRGHTSQQLGAGRHAGRQAGRQACKQAGRQAALMARKSNAGRNVKNPPFLLEGRV